MAKKKCNICYSFENMCDHEIKKYMLENMTRQEIVNRYIYKSNIYIKITTILIIGYIILGAFLFYKVMI